MLIRVVAAMLLIIIKLTNIFFTRAAEHMGISNLKGKCAKSKSQWFLTTYYNVLAQLILTILMF